jgi:hypothetical protein
MQRLKKGRVGHVKAKVVTSGIIGTLGMFLNALWRRRLHLINRE